MLRIIFLIGFSLASGLKADAQAAGCEPGEYEVTVYQHVDFEGICSVLGLGKYGNAAAMRMKNDSISSIKVGEHAQITVCNNKVGEVVPALAPDVWKMQCTTLKKSYTRLGYFGGYLYHDTISSATVARLARGDVHAPGDCSPDNSSEIGIYQHPNLDGACRILDVGSYANSKQMNFKNDSVSSIEFGPNSKVYAELCEHGGFKGHCETITATDINLKDNSVGDNKVTSIKVLRK